MNFNFINKQMHIRRVVLVSVVFLIIACIGCRVKKGKYDIVDKENPKIAIMANKEIEKQMDTYITNSLSYAQQEDYRNGMLKINKETWEWETKANIKKQRQKTGNAESDKMLAQMDAMQESMKAKMAEKMKGVGFNAIYNQQAPKNGDTYFKTIKEVETYARYGTESGDKFNHVEIRITFANGIVADKIYTGNRVLQSFGMGAQFLTKFIFEKGRVVRSYTNGAELQGGPDYVINDIRTVIEKVTHYDWEANHNKYFLPEKTQSDYKKEWDEVK
jgi:hypothetical protein